MHDIVLCVCMHVSVCVYYGWMGMLKLIIYNGKLQERFLSTDRLCIPGVILVMMELVYSCLSALMAASMDDSTLSRLIISLSSSFSFCEDFFAAR
jgi:hypothetical protein